MGKRLRRFLHAVGLICLVVFAATRLEAQSSWSNGYSYRAAITIDHTKVPNSDQINFPVLVSGSYAFLATTANGGGVTNANGYDIIFTSDASGTTVLPFERESYSASTGAVNYWVQVPNVSHTSDTVVYMFYGNGAVTTDQSSKTGVWDLNFVGVWHLPNGTTLTAGDSTSKANNGTVQGATAVSGKIGGGGGFSGSNQYVDVGNGSSLQITGTSITVEAWINTSESNPSQWKRIVCKELNGNVNPWVAYCLNRIASSNQIGFSVSHGGSGSNVAVSSASSLTMGAWTHVVGTYDGSTLKMYFNGSLSAQVSTTGNIISAPQDVVIGADTAANQEYFNGSIDEVRVSSVARSADWIATEYNNQGSPSSFYQVVPSNPPTITALSPSTSSSGASVTISGSNFGAAQGNSTVTFDGLAASITSWSSTSIVAAVPNGAMTGNVVVTVAAVPSNAVAFTVSPPVSWSNGYVFQRAIVIDHTKVPNTDQANFPVLISGTYSFLATTANGGDVTNANGYDIIFASDAAGATVLPFERESYSASTGAVIYWVKVPNLSHTADTVIYMFYGNGAVNTDQSNRTAVWDVNYQGVWHLGNGSTLNATDSTANANNGTISGNISAATGKINGAASASGGSNNGIGTTNSITADSSPFTYFFWVNSNGGGNTILRGEDGFGNGWSAALSLGSNFTFSIVNSSPAQVNLTSNASLTNGTWYNVAAVWTPGAGMKLYANGALDNSNTDSSTTLRSSTKGLQLLLDNGNNSFKGLLDEVQISNVARSADWIATEYNNQNNPSTFFSIGTAIVNGAGGTTAPYIGGLLPTSGPITTPVTILGANFGTTQGSSTVTFNGVAATSTLWTNSSILVAVPTAASTGNVIVTVAGGASNSAAFTVTNAPRIVSFSPGSGLVGAWVTLTGVNFGETQGSSTVTLNGVGCTVLSWSFTSITVAVPQGATSGPFTVTVAGQSSSSSTFTVATVPSGWMQQDIGPVGLTGSASYSNGVFTVSGAGSGIGGYAGSFHFVYQPLSGDGTIVARVVSETGSSTEGGVMITETLNGGSANAGTAMNSLSFSCSGTSSLYRTAVGNYEAGLNTSPGCPEWVKVVRSGNTLSMYKSSDGVNWVQVDSTQTITMAQNVYIGLFVTSGSTSTLGTVTFDNVSVNSSANPAPVITAVSATTGSIGSQVVISGTGFGTSQGQSLVTLNGAAVYVNSWSATSITIAIPGGATSGPLVVSVAPSMDDSNPVDFTVTSNPLPSSWLDRDIGPVGPAGSASYSNGVFTVSGAGNGMGGTQDWFHFAYQPLSGDGTIVARVVSSTGSSTRAGVMISETLDGGSAFASTQMSNCTSPIFAYRTAVGTNIGGANGQGSCPNWVKVVRSGSAFSGYTSSDGVNWVQIYSSPQTISMAQNVYIGLIVTSGSTSSLASATFDSVSISSSANPAPVITAVSATTGAVGGQVVITGTGFGATQGNSVVLLNGAATIINSWSATSITMTIPSGATSGYLVVSVAPSMNNSNPVDFTVTSNPLTPGWLDRDIGVVGLAGSAGYATTGKFTVNGAGNGMGAAPDSFHFGYQSLSGDGTIVARVVSETGSSTQAGVMISETLDGSSTNAFAEIEGCTSGRILYRTTTGANEGGNTYSGSCPYWVKLVRSGSTFTGYKSIDGVNWAQIDSSQTINMAQNVYIGLAVTSQSTTTLATAVFDVVSVNTAANPAPVITSTSATTGSVGSQVVISGTGFGTTQGSSTVLLNGTAATINSWSATSITITIPAGAASGYLVVAVAPLMNASNPVSFSVTSNPLPSGWLDQDIGSVGVAGGASYTSGTFVISAAGKGVINTASDSIHFVYQQLSGDGTILARVASAQGNGNQEAGVMIRETLNAGASSAASADYAYASGFDLVQRTSTGATSAYYNASQAVSATPPYWVKLTRSGNTFKGYASPDGIYWTQVGTTQTITMAQSVYVGLFADNENTGSTATASFDSVSFTTGTPVNAPVVTGASPTVVAPGNSVTITGSGFGATQGTSQAYFNGVAASSITSWSDTQVVATVPSAASTGPVTVVVNGLGSNRTVSITVYKPVISSLTPPAAQTGGTITIAGSGFGSSQGNSNVTFNGVTASVSSWSNTSITATVPSSATTGPVIVSQAGISSAGVQITVLEPLVVSSITPSSGPIGTSVTITGAGFGPTQSNSFVDFYGTVASVTSWSDTQITAVVASGSPSGFVDVTVAGQQATGPRFTLTRTVTLTDSLSNSTNYTVAWIGGTWVATNSQGSGCSTCSIRGTIQNTYDNNGNVLTRTDELSRTTTYTYDSNNNVASVSVPLGNGTNAVTSYTYNSFGEVLTTTDPLGNVTTNAYDTNGNLTKVTTPVPSSGVSASVTQFAYNALGQLVKITDPLQNVTNISYTAAGLIYQITDMQNHVTTYGYDAHGNRTSVTDAAQNQTAFAYDTGDRLKTITYPGSTGTTTFAYDYRGRRTSVTDQNGKTTSYAYDDADRLTTVTDAATPPNVTTYGYDTEDNLTSIQDANNHTTSFAYDAFGRVSKTTFPSSAVETYSYDAVGNLTGKTDRKNQAITYTYDQLNRLKQKQYPDNSAVNYTYDNDSRLTQVTDPTGTYSFTFDNMGRLTGTTTSYSFLTGRTFTTGYGYDAASNRTSFTDPENGASTYVYDTLNRLQTLAPPAAISGGSFGFGYDALSRRTSLTRPNAVNTSYSYDNLSRLLSVVHAKSGTTLDGAAYVVDNAGNRTSRTPQPAGTASNYSYDNIYQLTQVTQGASTTESYTYDPVGNRLSSLGVSPYSVNMSNQLTSIPGTMYTYDNNGNTQTKVVGSNTTTYAWDFENRLTSVTLPGSGGTVTFKYDPFGRRIYKSSSSGTSIYAHDGDDVVEETNSSGAVVARYARGLNVDDPLAMLRNSATSYYHADGLGSVTSLSNSTGSLAQTYSYDSFGKQTSSSGSLTNAFQYAAREFDTEASLYYYRARYYDPSSGRFISEDPIGFTGGLNFYRYSYNSANNFIDPFGLSPKSGGITKCFGVAFFTAVKNGQAPAGALKSRGIPASNGTVAVDPRDFGVPYPRGQNDSANDLRIATQDMLAYEYPSLVVVPAVGSGIAPPDAPKPPYPVSDIIDPRVLNHPRSVPTIDIYRVPTNAAANKLTGLHYTWIYLPSCSPFDCPAGFIKNPVGIPEP